MGVLKAKVGGAWVEVPGVGAWVDAVPWIPVTVFGGTWVNYDTNLYTAAAYRKVGDIVYLRGLVKGGVTQTPIFTLPVGYRPNPNRYHHLAAIANDAAAVVRVGGDGIVLASSGNVTTWWSIDSLSFSVTP